MANGRELLMSNRAAAWSGEKKGVDVWISPSSDKRVSVSKTTNPQSLDLNVWYNAVDPGGYYFAQGNLNGYGDKWISAWSTAYDVFKVQTIVGGNYTFSFCATNENTNVRLYYMEKQLDGKLLLSDFICQCNAGKTNMALNDGFILFKFEARSEETFFDIALIKN